MGGTTSQQEIVTEVTDMVSNIIVSVSLYCNTADIGNQTITITCDPPVADKSKNVYEANPACDKCMQDIVTGAIGYYQLQEAAWNNRPATVDKPIDSDFQNVINAFVVCTTQQCKYCDVQNVSQSNIIKSTTGCNAFNQVKNSINQKLTAAVSQALTNNQDMLSPLATLIGSSTYADVVTNITNRISAVITDNVIANVQTSINSQQNLTINNGNVVNGITQESSFTVVQNYLQKTKIINSIFSESEWTTLQNLINQQNTINSLGNVVTAAVTALSKLLSNVVGQVVFFVLILVGVLFVGICVYIITQVVRKQLKKQHDKDMVLKTQAEHLTEFEQF